ncbi:MAG TPA: FliG C-terminal domain-containing protein [Tepidisphaeraceae bacterium]
MTEPLHGIQKSAILLMSLSPQQAEEILKRVPPDAAQLVRHEMEALREIPGDARERVIVEYQRALRERDEPGHPSCPPAAAVLTDVSPEALVALLQEEHPQLIAAVLSMVPADQSGMCISMLPVQKQIDVFCRIAAMRPVNPQVRGQLLSLVQDRHVGMPQAHPTVSESELISRVLDEAVEPVESAAAVESAPENLRFDDLSKLADRSLHLVLDEVEKTELAMALSAASRQVRRKSILALTPQGAAELKRAADALGPVHLADVEAAQARILRVVHRLEAAGDIQLNEQLGRK